MSAVSRSIAGQEGIGDGAGGLVVPAGGEGVAGGALDELVDAYGLVRGGGSVFDEAEPVQGPQGVYRVLGGDRGRLLGVPAAASPMTVIFHPCVMPASPRRLRHARLK
ncbi:hypothetical protein ACF05L_34140 [Streptomyces bobili]|uniref:hypothetical protein n=1 Tax=Streptomyces bobili TaxID=67280 RepID=UPI0036FA1A91